jgi:hypothetical protein
VPNWEAIGAVGQLVGAAGVIVSIVYLAIQIRANTRTMRARAGFDATHSWAQSNDAWSQLSDEFLAQAARWFDPALRLEQLSDAEYARLSLVFRSVFQKLEGQYYLFRYGLLDAGIWETRSRVGRGIIELPALREWWDGELRNETFSAEFVRALTAARADDARGINRRPDP